MVAKSASCQGGNVTLPFEGSSLQQNAIGSMQLSFPEKKDLLAGERLVYGQNGYT